MSDLGHAWAASPASAAPRRRRIGPGAGRARLGVSDDEAESFVAWSRSQYAYGDLALACLRDTGVPWLPWQAWQAIFALPPTAPRNYATCAVITPIRNRLGWQITFPYRYGERYVTGFVNRV